MSWEDSYYTGLKFYLKKERKKKRGKNEKVEKRRREKEKECLILALGYNGNVKSKTHTHRQWRRQTSGMDSTSLKTLNAIAPFHFRTRVSLFRPFFLHQVHRNRFYPICSLCTPSFPLSFLFPSFSFVELNPHNLIHSGAFSILLAYFL